MKTLSSFQRQEKALLADVIKLFLEEIWKFHISPKAKTARIGYFKRNKKFLSIVLLKDSIILTFL